MPTGSGEDGGVIAITGLDQLIEKPGRSFGHRKTGSAITQNRLAARVLDCFLGVAHVPKELSGIHLEERPMTVAVRGNLMASCDCFPNEVRESFGNPTKEEAGGSRTCLTEHI